MWKQLRDADMSVGYEGGWCLKYVQDAYHTDHPYPTALSAWNANYGNGNHPGELPPAGKTVPVYFSLGNVPAGHVAISLDDGMVASSSQGGVHSSPYFHQNLANIIWVYGKYNGGCTYLGWSEYVGTVRVVEWQSDNATDDQIRQAYRDILEREADDGGLAHYRNYPIDFVRMDLARSPEKQELEARKAIPKPVITTKTEDTTEVLPFATISLPDNTMPLGESKVTQTGVNGKRVTTYTVTYTDGKETSRVVNGVSNIAPTDQILHVGTMTKDTEQDNRLSALEKIVKAITDFLASIFSGFKK